MMTRRLIAALPFWLAVLPAAWSQTPLHRPEVPPTGPVAPPAPLYDLGIETAACGGGEIRFDVRNMGPNDAPPTTVVLADASGRVLANFPIQPLPPGAALGFVFPGIVADQNYQVALPAGIDVNLANDLLPANCGPEFNWTLGGDDDGLVSCVGGRFVARVSNRGAVPAPPTTISVVAPGQPPTSGQVPSLQPGAAHRFDFRMTGPGPFAVFVRPTAGDANPADNWLHVNC